MYKHCWKLFVPVQCWIPRRWKELHRLALCQSANSTLSLKALTYHFAVHKFQFQEIDVSTYIGLCYSLGLILQSYKVNPPPTYPQVIYQNLLLCMQWLSSAVHASTHEHQLCFYTVNEFLTTFHWWVCTKSVWTLPAAINMSSYIHVSPTTDIDECAQDQDDCHPNAACVNTVGSYTCQCNTGFQGDGRGCTG